MSGLKKCLGLKNQLPAWNCAGVYMYNSRVVLKFYIIFLYLYLFLLWGWVFFLASKPINCGTDFV